MGVLDKLDWPAVRAHYDARIDVHHELVQRHRRTQRAEFVDLALGIEDPAGNYSASEHGLGPKILATNRDPVTDVYDLATALLGAASPRLVPSVIQKAAITNLRVGVGTELSCMLAPDRFWVTNARTLWTHLLFKHHEDKDRANEELRLYKDDDSRSEMYYPIWGDLHQRVGPSMRTVATLANATALAEGVTPGPITHLWADAIASVLYSLRND